MPLIGRETFVIWDITYGCPLRCAYCYSESGRRPSRALDDAAFMRAAEALVAAGVRLVAFSGGEPTLVPALVAAARRFRESSAMTHLYTSGFGLERALAEQLVGCFRRIHVSVDGATAATHDRIRGRAGSFDQAMSALELLVSVARGTRARVGVELSAVRSNVHELTAFCREMARRFPTLDFLSIGAAVPSGLANRPSFEDELLDGPELEALRGPGLRAELARSVPPTMALSITDNWHLLPAERDANIPIQIEPDGHVRAFPVYEGTVGNILDEPLEDIWARARERHRDPVILEWLSKVSTMKEWAATARRIDERFGAPADLARIRKRAVWADPPPAG